MDKKPELGTSLTGELGTNLTGGCVQTSNSLIERMINSFKCKVCGHVGKVTIIISHPVETICEACQRNEKIENLLK
jgi:hypothetical protein